MQRELTKNNGGFYSALDADSEGVEGKFYVWSYDEVKKIVGERSHLFCKYFDITQEGNWEENNIPRQLQSFKNFARENDVEEDKLEALLQDGKRRLLAQRQTRVKPMLDDKILLSWNALMNIAYSKAFGATGNIVYKEAAQKNMDFLLTEFGLDDEDLHHTWQHGKAKHPPFLEDYSYLIAALIELAQVMPDYSYLERAGQLVEIVIKKYGDDLGPFFFYTAEGQADILLRKKETYDGATPSANAVMASNLYKLGILFDNKDWQKRAEGMVIAIGDMPIRYPTSFGVWLSAIYEMLQGTTELAIIGDEWEPLLGNIQKYFIPFSIIMASAESNNQFPLLANKKKERKTHIFLCKNYSCQKPLTELKEVLALIGSNNLISIQ